MKLYATITSERSTKGQGGNDFLEIVITGAHETELITLKIHPNGSKYELRGWTHDNHFIQMMIEENLAKGKKQKDECTPNSWNKSCKGCPHCTRKLEQD